jgi:hypothetical protein
MLPASGRMYTHLSEILLWLRLRCVTLMLSARPLASMRSLSSSSPLLLSSSTTSVSVSARPRARHLQQTTVGIVTMPCELQCSQRVDPVANC